jgi:hypothetical protein
MDCPVFCCLPDHKLVAFAMPRRAHRSAPIRTAAAS